MRARRRGIDSWYCCFCFSRFSLSMQHLMTAAAYAPFAARVVFAAAAVYFWGIPWLMDIIETMCRPMYQCNYYCCISFYRSSM